MISSFALMANNNAHGWDIDSIPKIIDNTGILTFTDANSFYFTSNGLWLYIFSSDFYIRQYSLSVAFDTRTAINTGKTKLLDAYTTLSTPSFMISNDGTKLLIKKDNFYISQLSMSTPFDITTATTNGAFYSDIGALSFTINTSGNRLYLYGGDEVLYEFALSTTWDITTASITGVSKSFISNGSGIYSIGISSDNLKLYFNSSASDYIYTYSLSTAGDITTAILNSSWSYYGKFSQSVSGDMLYSQMSPSGDRFFILDNRTNNLFNAECIYSGVYGQPKATGYLATELTIPSTNQGLVLSTDGTKLFMVTGSLSEYITTYTLNVPYNITLGFSSYTTSTVIVQYIGNMNISYDGTKLGIYDYTNSIYKLYTLTTAWDINTRVLLSTKSNTNFTTFSKDGTKFYVKITGGITEYNLSTAWDLSTAIAGISNTNLGTNDRYHFSPDGMVLLGSKNTLNQLRQYNLITPWSLSGILEFANITILNNAYLCFNYTGDIIYSTMPNSASIYMFSINL